MKRALALALAVSGVTFAAPALAAGTSISGSIYAADIDVNAVGSASPDGLLLEIRHPLNRNFWIGATLATALGDDQVGLTSVELGNSFAVNLGVQAELAHRMYGYAYLGYGAAEVSATGGGASDIDGKGVAFGLGMQFLLNDHLLVDAGYASLFDGDMEDSTGASADTQIAGPRVGLGYRF